MLLTTNMQNSGSLFAILHGHPDHGNYMSGSDNHFVTSYTCNINKFHKNSLVTGRISPPKEPGLPAPTRTQITENIS
ncbi:MAG: hypothetical protein [Microvirus sp.]|nr:MAG: hypothetical protein [Microvirus sp.]